MGVTSRAEERRRPASGADGRFRGCNEDNDLTNLNEFGGVATALRPVDEHVVAVWQTERDVALLIVRSGGGHRAGRSADAGHLVGRPDRRRGPGAVRAGRDGRAAAGHGARRRQPFSACRQTVIDRPDWERTVPETHRRRGGTRDSSGRPP